MSRTVKGWLVFATVVLVILAEWRGQAQTPPLDGEAQLRAQVARWIGQLDDRRFALRREAAARLEGLLARPEHAAALAEEFRRVLVDPRASYEVRWRLERWSRQLPTPAPVESVTAAEIATLIDQLDDDSFPVRVGAGRRLKWICQNPKLVEQVLRPLKAALNDPRLAEETRHYLEPAWEEARAAWLLRDPAQWASAAVSEEQIRQWIDGLARPAPKEAESPWQMHEVARRELLDALADDQRVPRIRALLDAKLTEKLTEQGAARLQELVDLTRPALVAEYWQEHRHLGEQHLLVGEPTISEGASRPSHFDRCDDQTAHCISGNTLGAGEYPVGVAFPHPIQDVAFFHLVNLPTPRRRMAYAYEVRRPETLRLAEISRRTLDRFLAAKRALEENELTMLGLLDREEVSRFAGSYFLAVSDQALPPSGRYRSGGRPSRHGVICAQLAASGTNTAVPGLLEALEKNRFEPPGPLSPYALPWVAALAIAVRDPWPEADAWLASVIARDVPLIYERTDGPELGATAAALLLARHGERLVDFGLQPVRDSLLAEHNISAGRFISAESRERVSQWWRHKTQSSPAP